MIKLPKNLQPFKNQADKLIDQGWIHEMQFSNGTYQIQFVNPKTKKDCWTYLQIDNRGKIKDGFCSCDECEESLVCPHLAASYLYIYKSSTKPLHERFKVSLWNVLGKLYEDLFGDNTEFKKGSGCAFEIIISKKRMFSVQGKTAKVTEILTDIIDKTFKETEANSLKFSNLSEEELHLYHQGKPSPDLRYELSLWHDLAQFLFLLQIKESPYEIKFSFDKTSIPNGLTVEFKEVKVFFYLPHNCLPQIIPALKTVQSPLEVHYTSQDAVEKITYDEKKGAFIVFKQEKSKDFSHLEGEKIDGWIYQPQVGFFSKEPHPLFNESLISSEKIPALLNEHFHLIKKYLTNLQLHKESIKVSYHLSFDMLWNLHIQAYLFSSEDLKNPYSRFFGNWAYIQNDGFYPIEDNFFSEKHLIIPKDKVSDFVTKERAFLNTQEGFSTHISTVEASLNYTVTEDETLKFIRLVDVKNKSNIQDFDAWIYLKDKGFYPKTLAYVGTSLHPDLVISKTHVSLFIKENESELRLISGFFSNHSPIKKLRLETSFKDEKFTIQPVYDFLEGYNPQNVLFFDDYTYVKDEGFIEIPAEFRLKEIFRHPILIEKDQIPSFLEEESKTLKSHEAYIDSRLTAPEELILKADEITREDSSESSWYAVKIKLKSNLGENDITPLYTFIKKKRLYYFSEAGCIDLQTNRFDWLKNLPASRVDKKNNVITLSTLELMRLDALEKIEVTANTKTAFLLDELRNLKVPELPDISGLKSKLRPYQHLGLHWLFFLHYHKLSGLLCDEMGLGKTHQAMALIAAIYNKNRSEKNSLPFLVICPTSVIYHWQEKLQEFFPTLRILTFHGLKRSLEGFPENYDLFLTSYGIFRIDYEKIKNFTFEVAIFDEIQIAKNYRSRLHKTLKHVLAKMRVGLTGTPIENYLRELKSLFDLVLPSYMPNDIEYRELFLKPIERDNDPDRKMLLKRFINPFVLRRKKQDVLLDLPEKTEEIIHCDLSSEQQHLYNQVLQQSRSTISDLKNPHSQVSYVHIFSILSSLKQICNHPSVFLKNTEHYKKHASGKWNLFLELFSEAKESGQKIVIFSQYLMMLDIFEEYLKENNIAFATIRGSTINRGEEVYRFNHDPECKVFLGSLQASGLGIDLTAGSVVIHYDRWWNAARENQATDRVHRIGQTRGVQVLKLVTKNTFEERIDALITKKANLMEDIVSPDDHRFMKQFTRNELIELLQEVEETKEELPYLDDMS